MLVLSLSFLMAITFDALMLGFAIAFELRGQAKVLLEKQFRAKKKRDTACAPHLSWTAQHALFDRLKIRLRAA
jgi:hypothetical protein